MTNKQAKYIALQIAMAIETPAFLAIAIWGHGLGMFIAGLLTALNIIGSFIGVGSWRKLTNDEYEL